MMHEGVRVALDPTPAQERALLSHAGAARFAYNAGLAHVHDALDHGERPEWSYYSLRRWWNANKDELAPWWRDNSKEAYNTGLEELARALGNFSDSRRGRRAGRRMGFPRFKSKDKVSPRFAYTTGSFGLIDADQRALRLPRVGRVHCMEDVARRVSGGKVSRMTVSRRAGRWYASLTVERPDPPERRPKKGAAVGIDLGIKELATLSDGTVCHNPRTLDRNLRRLAREQRSLSRKRKGSARHARQRRRVARLHARVANQRADALHKLTSDIAATYADVSIEDLNVAGMVRNHHLARAIEDASFAEFRRQLGYKCERTGTRLHVIDRFYPSSKTCSACGSVKAKLSLGERTYVCEECGLVMDRDLNAAINIMVAGSAPETLNAHGADVRPIGRKANGRTATKCEPSSHSGGVGLGAVVREGDLQARTN